MRLIECCRRWCASSTGLLDAVRYWLLDQDDPPFTIEECREIVLRRLIHIPCKGIPLLELVAAQPALRAVVEEEIMSLELDMSRLPRFRCREVTPLGWDVNKGKPTDLLDFALPCWYRHEPGGNGFDRRIWPQRLQSRPETIKKADAMEEYNPTSVPVAVALLDILPRSSPALAVTYAHLLLCKNESVASMYRERGIPRKSVLSNVYKSETDEA